MHFFHTTLDCATANTTLTNSDTANDEVTNEHTAARGGVEVHYLGIESYRNVSIFNWAENVQFRPEIVFYPKSKEEIIAIVQDAKKNNKRITMIGKGHCGILMEELTT
jgi:soluble P-type ATPase